MAGRLRTIYPDYLFADAGIPWGIALINEDEMGEKTPFLEVVDEIVAMHNRKQADYGRENDPFANVRASEDFGIAPWVGAMVRANDKMRRLQAAARGSTLQNEGIEDSLIDIAVYAMIAVVLLRDETKGA